MCGRTPTVSIQRESVSVPHRNDRQTGQRAVSRNAYGTHALHMSSHLSGSEAISELQAILIQASFAVAVARVLRAHVSGRGGCGGEEQ
jgi:hypothetical protein